MYSLKKVYEHELRWYDDGRVSFLDKIILGNWASKVKVGEEVSYCIS